MCFFSENVNPGKHLSFEWRSFSLAVSRCTGTCTVSEQYMYCVILSWPEVQCLHDKTSCAWSFWYRWRNLDFDKSLRFASVRNVL